MPLCDHNSPLPFNSALTMLLIGPFGTPVPWAAAELGRREGGIGMALDTRGYRLSRPLRALVLATTIATLGLPTETASATHKPARTRSSFHQSARSTTICPSRGGSTPLEQPNSENPLLDETGKHCQDAQAGPVFFLVGTAGTGQATRDECVVPFGKLLYFPLVNAFDVHVPGDGLDTPELVVGGPPRRPTGSASTPCTPPSTGNRSATSTPRRAHTGDVQAQVADARRTFSFDFPADNLFDLSAGTYAPAVADGFYLLLPATALPVRRHRDHVRRHREP